MAGLAEAMKAKYGMSKGEEKSEGPESSSDSEGAKLGARLSSAIKSGDGELIYNAFAALKSHCDMKG